jgi:hypothetical protein
VLIRELLLKGWPAMKPSTPLKEVKVLQARLVEVGETDSLELMISSPDLPEGKSGHVPVHPMTLQREEEDDGPS